MQTTKLYSLYLGGEFQMIAPLSVIANTLNLHRDALARIAREEAAHMASKSDTSWETQLHKDGRVWQVRHCEVFVTVATYGPEADIAPHIGLGLTAEASRKQLDEEIRSSYFDEDGAPAFDEEIEEMVAEWIVGPTYVSDVLV